MKKNKSLIKTIMLVVILASIFTACSPAASPAEQAKRTAAGNWEAFKTIVDGYGDSQDLF